MSLKIHSRNLSNIDGMKFGTYYSKNNTNIPMDSWNRDLKIYGVAYPS